MKMNILIPWTTQNAYPLTPLFESIIEQSSYLTRWSTCSTISTHSSTQQSTSSTCIRSVPRNIFGNNFTENSLIYTEWVSRFSELLIINYYYFLSIIFSATYSSEQWPFTMWIVLAIQFIVLFALVPFFCLPLQSIFSSKTLCLRVENVWMNHTLKILKYQTSSVIILSRLRQSVTPTW